MRVAPGDNPPAVPARPVDVPDGDDLVPELRRSFAGAVAGTRPTRPDLAGRAIAAARRVRRRRRVAGGALVAMAVLAAGWLPAAFSAPAPPAEFGFSYGTATAPSSAPPAPESVDTLLLSVPRDGLWRQVDLVARDANPPVLVTGERRQVTLSPVTEVVSAHRVGAGWAVVSRGASQRALWWVTPEHGATPVLTGMDAIVVDRASVAWRLGSSLNSAELSESGQLVGQVRISIDGEVAPVGFAGEAVLVRRGEQWGVWRPDRGEAGVTWADQVVAVFGGLPDGGTAVGLAADPTGRDCLALLDVNLGLTPTARSCAHSPAPEVVGGVSPDGRWLLCGDPADGKADLVDLAAAFDDTPADNVVIADLPVPVRAPVWLGGDTALYASAGQLVQVQVGEKLVAETPYPGDPPLLVAAG